MKKSSGLSYSEPKAGHSKRSVKHWDAMPAAFAGISPASVAASTDTRKSRGGARAAAGCKTAVSVSVVNCSGKEKTHQSEETNKVPCSGTARSSSGSSGGVQLGRIHVSLDDFNSVPGWIWGRYLLLNYTVKNFKVDGRPINNLEMMSVINAHQKRRMIENELNDRAKANNGKAEADQNAGIWSSGCR
tara:strand:+ start:361 stop:924 length:564 start_codon:yes stop_codon:yes gene_type:complete